MFTNCIFGLESVRLRNHLDKLTTDEDVEMMVASSNQTSNIVSERIVIEVENGHLVKRLRRDNGNPTSVAGELVPPTYK